MNYFKILYNTGSELLEEKPDLKEYNVLYYNYDDKLVKEEVVFNNKMITYTELEHIDLLERPFNLIVKKRFCQPIIKKRFLSKFRKSTKEMKFVLQSTHYVQKFKEFPIEIAFSFDSNHGWYLTTCDFSDSNGVLNRSLLHGRNDNKPTDIGYVYNDRGECDVEIFYNPDGTALRYLS